MNISSTRLVVAAASVLDRNLIVGELRAFFTRSGFAFLFPLAFSLCCREPTTTFFNSPLYRNETIVPINVKHDCCLRTYTPLNTVLSYLMQAVCVKHRNCIMYTQRNIFMRMQKFWSLIKPEVYRSQVRSQHLSLGDTLMMNTRINTHRTKINFCEIEVLLILASISHSQQLLTQVEGRKERWRQTPWSASPRALISRLLGFNAQTIEPISAWAAVSFHIASTLGTRSHSFKESVVTPNLLERLSVDFFETRRIFNIFMAIEMGAKSCLCKPRCFPR